MKMDGLPPLPRKKQTAAFYELPKRVQSSSRVIEEARQSVRYLPTSRPYTPAHSTRSLYGGGNGPPGRPPSVFSLSHSVYLDEQSRPSTSQKLAPIPLSKVPDAVKLVPLAPSQSYASLSPSPPPSSASISTAVTSDREMPQLIESKHSPERSRRVSSATQSIMASVVTTKRISSAGDIIDKKKQTKKELKGKEEKMAVQEVWVKEVVPLVEVMEKEREDVERLCSLCEELWRVLESNDMLGRTGGRAGTKRRSLVLKCVFKLLHLKNPKLLMKLAKIILAMKVTGKNLQNGCKLVFALSREDTNDHLFIEEKISGLLINLLLTCDPLNVTDAVVYGVGTLKLLASNPQLRAELETGGVTDLVQYYLEQCSSLVEPSDEELANTGCVLVQLSAMLRNLSDSPCLYHSFHPLLPTITTSLTHHLHNTELIFNMSRFLSKLSLHKQSCATIINCTELLSLSCVLLSTHINNPDISVRLGFFLGNITAESHLTSWSLCESDSLLPITENLMDHYLTILVREEEIETTDDGVLTRPEDVLIKAARLLANLSVHDRVAGDISNSSAAVELIMRILTEVSVSQYNELIFNTLALLNNLTYYCSDGCCLDSYRNDITLLMVEFLFEDNSDVMLECCRVLGNFSRHADVRTTLAEKRVDELMVTLLDSKHVELVYSSCGVLINLLSVPQHRSILTENNGVRKLVDVLTHFGRQDWQLASLVCKTLWNYSENITTAVSCFGKEEADILIHLLEDYLDPVTAFMSFNGDSEEMELSNDTAATSSSQAHSSHHHQQQQMWENEFVPVARSLLNRIQHQHTHIEPH